MNLFWFFIPIFLLLMKILLLTFSESYGHIFPPLKNNNQDILITFEKRVTELTTCFSFSELNLIMKVLYLFED